jgi:hypothetical protein
VIGGSRTRVRRIPEGLRVLADGSWRVGDEPVRHPESLRYFKEHLDLEDPPAIVVDGKRVPVVVEGPAFEVLQLVVDGKRGECRVLIDDGAEELLADDTLGMSPATGRFECVVRGGRGRALLSRGAHQTLLDAAVEDGGAFYLQAGPRRIRIRT